MPDYSLIIGAGESVYDQTSVVPIDTGYSGNPLAMVPFRPPQSAESWMYISDCLKSRKIRADRTNYAIGITPPNAPPDVQRGYPFHFDVDSMFATWTAAGTSAANSFAARFSETIDQILYDSGSTGWALIKTTLTAPPVLPSTYQVGALITLTGATTENEKIRQVNTAITSTTIASILYDSGSSGLCSISLTDKAADYTGLVPDSMLLLGGTEYVRVLSVTNAPDGTRSFRCSTIATFAATNTVDGVYSFRIFTLNTYAPGDTLTGAYNSFPTTTGLGWLYKDTSAVPVDLFNIGGRPLQQEDYAHVSLKVDDVAKIDRIRFYLNIDLTFPTFPLITNALYYEIPAEELSTGWNEIFWHISDFIHTGLGNPGAQALSHVSGIIVEVVAVDAGTPVTVYFDDWWVGGTFGLDSSLGLDFVFYQRYRSTITGARSNPSPVTRSGLNLQREQAVVTPVVSPDPQVDRIDIFVQGGTLSTPRLAVSLPNAALPFGIDIANAQLALSEELRFDLFQPFPESDLPRSGLCDVSGTSVIRLSGDLFNLTWQPGSQIIINNVPYTLYASPSSTGRLELVENAGAQTNVEFILPEPTLGGVPTPALWGPDPLTGVMFACGHANEPGVLKWSNPNDPDSASDANSLEITSPSEPLQNGFMYDGRCYVFSIERLFLVTATSAVNPITGISTLTYTAQEVPNAKGLYGIFAYAVADSFWVVSRNGVWEYGSNGLVSITDDTLYPLFPHNGQLGEAVNGYNPINYGRPDAIRLDATKDALYLTYLDSECARICMMYDRTLPSRGWFPVSYPYGEMIFYEEEGRGVVSVLMGALTGQVYRINVGTTDDGADILFDCMTRAFDLDDPRLQKLFLDYMFDADLQGIATTLTPYMDNLLTALLPTTLFGLTGRSQTPVSLIGQNLTLYRNIALRISGQTPLGSPVFFEFEPNAVLQPYLAVNMTSPNYISHGFTKYGFLRDGWITYISTSTIFLDIITDLGLTQQILIPSSAGAIQKYYFPISPLKGLLFFYNATAAQPFALFTNETIIRAKEWGVNGAFQPMKPFAGQSA